MICIPIKFSFISLFQLFFTSNWTYFLTARKYNGPERPPFSSMVSCEVFSKSDIVLGSLKQFSELWNTSRKSQIVFGSLKQFSEFLNSSRNSHTVLGRFKQFSVALDGSWKSQTVLAGLKQLNVISNCPRSLKQFSVVADTFYHLVLFPLAVFDCCQIGLQTRFLLTKFQFVTQNFSNARMAQDGCYRNKINYSNNNKTEFKDIIQCQRVIPAEPNFIIKFDQHRMI